ncbi:uracil-DNA glycosylase [Synoicihabitans lomoniglobus]|uniref:Type-4 uracil-DNA glycosylase n=1 Tax=Synoicihabitans lomoniglobus TaxID=2909285 RepID=A0AAF0CSB6_9BACT|nr:uracil-DNA glycosylase [Opitutaceae bacterium LMO-M01]WED67132.1 uracil-DNA glycosylase [Opitutaceae bacterium LMO-M01]
MRATLHALTEELRRLKTTGVKTVSVSEESLSTLRALVRARQPATPVGQPETMAEAPPAAAERGTSRGKSSWTPPVVPKRTAPAPVESGLPSPPEVVLPDGDKPTQWKALLAQVTNDPVCRENIRAGKKVVLGVGNLDAKIFFCGEAPGAEEEVKGEPFVGPAGQLLTKMIGGMALQRDDVYIGNIMNWRPQMPTIDGQEQVGNRPPSADEMNYCMPYWRAQLKIVQPEVIVALGSTAAKGLLGAGSFKTLGEIRGKWHTFEGTPVMVTYHPSYILRNQSNRSKRAIWEDLLQVMERVALPISDKQRGYFQAR